MKKWFKQEINWLKRHSLIFWIEYIFYRFKFRYFSKLHITTNFPIYLLIEPSSACNFKCPICFQSDLSFTDKGFMDLNLFKNLVNQAKAGGTKAITLASRGEPLLNPQIDEMFKYLHQSGILDIKLNTNAYFLDKHIKAILENEINEVVFSINTSDISEKVIENIKLFNKVRVNYPKTTTRIQFMITGIDKSKWIKMANEVVFKKPFERWDSYNNKYLGLKKPCNQLWRQMYVWYDGTVNPCDFDYKSYLKLGDAKTTSLKEIWQTKMREFQLDNLKNREKYNPCDKCPL